LKIKIIIFLAIVILAVALTFLLKQPKAAKETEAENSQVKIKIGLVTGIDGLGDKAYNDIIFKGIILCQKKYNVDYEYVVPKSYSVEDEILALKELVAKKCDIIFSGSSYDGVVPLDCTAYKYPNTKFVLLDEPLSNYYPNAASITSKQNEGSFLAGALAAMVSKKQNIAMIGGADYPAINDFFAGYQAGAKLINPQIKVLIKYIADDNDKINPWASPDLAKKIALDLYTKNNVDIIFQVASASGMGVFKAAQETGNLTIGVDADQDYLAEGYILTSMMKRYDESILYFFGEFLEGRFKNQNYSLGLAEKGVSLTEMQFSQKYITPVIKEKLVQIEKDIINGTIKVPTTLN